MKKKKKKYGFHTETQSQPRTEYVIINSQSNQRASYNKKQQNITQSSFNFAFIYIMECRGQHYS